MVRGRERSKLIALDFKSLQLCEWCGLCFWEPWKLPIYPKQSYLDLGKLFCAAWRFYHPAFLARTNPSVRLLKVQRLLFPTIFLGVQHLDYEPIRGRHHREIPDKDLHQSESTLESILSEIPFCAVNLSFVRVSCIANRSIQLSCKSLFSSCKSIPRVHHGEANQHLNPSLE